MKLIIIASSPNLKTTYQMSSTKQEIPSEEVEVVDRPRLALMIIMLLCVWTFLAITVYRAIVDPSEENWKYVFRTGFFVPVVHITAAHINITKTVSRPIV